MQGCQGKYLSLCFGKLPRKSHSLLFSLLQPFTCQLLAGNLNGDTHTVVLQELGEQYFTGNVSLKRKFPLTEKYQLCNYKNPRKTATMFSE